MNFNLTKEQEIVKKMVREFTENEVKPIAAEIDQTERFPMENVEKMKKYGFFGMNMPKEYGGAGTDEMSYVLAVEELSRYCATTGVILSAHNSLACWPIYKFGTEEQKQKYLVPLAKGKKLGSFALTEPNAGTDAAGQQTFAKKDGEDWIINGSKIFITNGKYADIYVIFAMTEPSKGTRGISAFIIEKGMEGFSIGKIEDKMGIRGSATAELIFQNLRVPKENMLGQEGKGFKIAMQTLDGGRIGIAAQALGIAQGAMDETLNYINQREQFGRSISKFQALQFNIADMETQIQAARLLVYQSAQAKNDGQPYSKLAAMAKLFAAETAMFVTTKAVQLHGGYGYTKDYPVERMMRDAKITEIYEGTSEVQRMVIAANTIK
ncbi:acyl-CoA dehydrogenase [Oceanotoga sp. DSM 15011]|uniref:Butyryl-CoA dehydrogenase n=1 Tax=Oceanotoga teriensis TaxID=515440 RepID=A0AA45C852_9BACT|nr:MULTISPECIES: acyl-CoA dehydrogenase [Oceanotoga]MDN5341309.1 butyryl-CoA dehydrogenase [Oceanotoga sp.]MDO7976965.1 acyl-CoA dehydrogenase [Oceanotoga teriensis]PWJ95733.1 butyryl-CoA dehydrogenase [Oceanotoga teriensis]UYO99566.1 acyl-CoA dehydrogenase [Oceanotoga sp. DSM 15011]